MIKDIGKLQDELRLITAKIIEVDPQKIGTSTSFVDELGADSMMLLEIMATLEKKYGVVISEEDLVKLNNLDQVTKLMTSLLNFRK